VCEFSNFKSELRLIFKVSSEPKPFEITNYSHIPTLRAGCTVLHTDCWIMHNVLSFRLNAQFNVLTMSVTKYRFHFRPDFLAMVATMSTGSSTRKLKFNSY
jgi:hypothetical protein